MKLRSTFLVFASLLLIGSSRAPVRPPRRQTRRTQA